MLQEEQSILDRKEQVEQKLQQRNQMREVQVEAARTARSTAGQESTEDLVVQFHRDMEPMVEDVENMLKQSSLLPAGEVNSHLDLLVVKLQKMQEFVTEAGMFLPPYDVKKSQKTLSSLNTQFQEMQEKVKPKKKFGFKKSKQKTAAPAPVTAPDISSLSVVDAAPGYTSSNSCSLSNLTDQTVTLTREQVEARDVSLDNLTNCRVEIQGPPSTLHMSSMTNCTILSGPVSTSVFVDICSSSTLSISCQQMRTHRTTKTDIYLHTTAKAILEDCGEVRVAPYSWRYPGMEEDFMRTGLEREVNHWDQIGDFNWLALDKPSPNWSILPVEQRRLDWS